MFTGYSGKTGGSWRISLMKAGKVSIRMPSLPWVIISASSLMLSKLQMAQNTIIVSSTVTGKLEMTLLSLNRIVSILNINKKENNT